MGLMNGEFTYDAEGTGNVSLAFFALGEVEEGYAVVCMFERLVWNVFFVIMHGDV